MNYWLFNEAQLREALAEQVEALVELGVPPEEAHAPASAITDFLHARPVSDRHMLMVAPGQSAARKSRDGDINPRQGDKS